MSTPSDVNGRLVEVGSRFSREAVKPGGVSRAGARVAADRSVAEIRGQVEQQLADYVAPLAALLRAWPGDAERGCALASAVRDVAGLVDRHLLTEVAMHTFDCLDAVLIDGASMTQPEAACFADALLFAQQGECRGSDLEPFRALLTELQALTSLVIERGGAEAQATPA